MKRLIYYIGILTLLFCHACTTEVDELFDKNASERVNEKVQECKSLLTSAPNGWVIEYYPAAGQIYGGFNVIAKFDNSGNVTIAGEIASADDRITSHYSIITSNSVVLTFDTYNEIFHYFSDPDIGGGSSYGGDFEFTYFSGNAKEMIFKGTKTENIIVFTALEEDITWEEYLAGATKMSEDFVLSPYIGFVWNSGASDELEFIMEDGLNILTYVPDNSRPEVSEAIAFRYTPTGIRLYEAVRIGNVYVKTLDWDDDAQKLVSVDGRTETGEGASVSLEGTFSDNYVPYDTFLGNWIFSYNNGSNAANMEIVTKTPGVSYVLKGLSYDIELAYSKKTGNLSMTVQALGVYGSYYVYLCPWDTVEGRLTWGSGMGFDLIYNRDDMNPKLTFTDNGTWAGYNINGMLFYAFSAPGPSGAVGSVAQYPNLVDLHK